MAPSAARQAVTDLAQTISAQLNAGTVGRATIGDRAVAFDWTAGITPSPLTVFAGAVVEGLTYRATTVTPTATPAKKVAPGSPKPLGATIVTSTQTLDTYAGIAEVQNQQLIDSDGLIPAIENVLFDQAVNAFYLDVGAELTDAALAATGPTWADAILAGIAMLPSADILVISPADLAAVVSPSSGFQVALTQAIPVVFGLGMIALPGLPAGTAYVMKSSALTVFDSKVSPAVIVNPYEKSSTNVTSVVCDLFCAAALNAPGAVVAVTVAP